MLSTIRVGFLSSSASRPPAVIAHIANRLEPLSPVDQPNAQFENPGYTIGDLRAGIVGDDWQFDVFVNNLTDERAWYTIGTGQYLWTAAQTVEGRAHHQNVYANRPIEFGVRYMKRWGD